MHRCDILHNDLKGDNVLPQEREDLCVPKLTDFGKATLAQNPAVYSYIVFSFSTITLNIDILQLNSETYQVQSKVQ